METFFAVTAPGLERFTARELAQLNLVPSNPVMLPTADNDETGGIEFQGDMGALYRANLHLRTASRVLVRLGAFYATNFEELTHNTSRLPWKRYLLPGQAVSIRVSSQQSSLYIERNIIKAVAAALKERFGQASPIEHNPELPSQLIIVRLVRNRCTVSLDSSGEHLHRRGYRLAVAKAPLRETLAAGMLMAAGWDASGPLLDPFCGSGTLPIEAAMLASHIAPGLKRQFQFMQWPVFDSVVWEQCLKEARAQQQPCSVAILGSDRDAGAIQSARANAERAGVAESIDFSCRAFSAIEPPSQKGWLVTNPPYGVRLSGQQDLRNLYDQLGNVLRKTCPGWRAAILCNDEKMVSRTRLNFGEGLSFSNGGIGVKCALGTVPE